MTKIGDVTPETMNTALADAADQLGRWDEACLLLENGGDPREALSSIVRAAQGLERALVSIAQTELSQTLEAVVEYAQLAFKCPVEQTSNASVLIKMIYDVLARYIVGLRTNLVYREDLSKLNDFIQQHRTSLLNTLLEERMNMDSLRISNKLETIHLSDASAHRSPTRTKGRKLVASSPYHIQLNQDECVQSLIEIAARISAQQETIEGAASQPEIPLGELKRMISDAGLMLSELRESVVRLRHVPIKSLFERLALSAADFAGHRSVALRVECEGIETLIDHETLENLYEPLENLVCELVESGLEGRKERISSSVRPLGFLRISARTENANVVIVVEDHERVPGDAQPIEKCQDEFVPDAIREKMDWLAATVTIDVAAGQWTRLEVILPTSRRLLELVLVSCNERLYAVPSHVVQEIVEPGCFSTHVLRGDKQLIEVKGRLFPFATLRELFETTASAELRRVRAAVAIEQGYILLMRTGRDLIAVGVEKVMRTTKMLVSPPQPHLRGVRGFIGTVVSGMGEPVLVVDVSGIASAFFGSQQERRVA